MAKLPKHIEKIILDEKDGAKKLRSMKRTIRKAISAGVPEAKVQAMINSAVDTKDGKDAFQV